MGFIVFGEIVSCRRAVIRPGSWQDLVAAGTVAALDRAFAGYEMSEVAGFAPGAIYINNYLKTGGGDADLVLELTPPLEMETVDWQTAPNNTLQSVQRTAHGWLYSVSDAPFNPALLTVKWKRLELQREAVAIACIFYDAVPLKCMLPPPSQEAIDLAATNPKRLNVSSDPLEFVTYRPYRPPVLSFAFTGDYWSSTSVRYECEGYKLHPTTERLYDRLKTMNAHLLEDGVVCSDIKSGGHSVSSCWDSVKVTDEHKRILGVSFRHEVPIAWYSVQHRMDWDVTDSLQQEFDPENLVEEVGSRWDEYAGIEADPGTSRTRVYFLASSGKAVNIARTIVSAANRAELLVKWDGDPKMSIEVSLPS